MLRQAIRAIGAVGLMLCFQAPLQAAPPPNADPELAPWFRNLRQPKSGLSCCDLADCRRVQYRVANGHFQAFIGGEFARWQNPPYAWVDVPETSVLYHHDNPTGEGIACWSGNAIICFIEGSGA
ncbi:hypothetical protein [Rhodopila sp.]|uniref:hypothetical protein n=1 Tax=Rhodopila sp. TaxID=2480087 RepID=UPI003D12A465